MALDKKYFEEFQSQGFEGFLSVSKLKSVKFLNTVPRQTGVYLVLNPTQEKPEFLDESVGGHFRGRNPTKCPSFLEENWVDGAKILYVGHAPKRTLYKRISELIRFGSKNPIGHWGGRLIWQLENHNELLICWLAHKDPVEIRNKIIREFEFEYKALPFANLQGST